ncbi:hypothetical protein CRE_15932 [Caenorhabditis remanei]|uniref:Uncharacterized protein n=1 Tax=Caenorhabditis remanei TaxID=31234 RepID=E3MBM2_CAERE|nr:hypothetical protein CRE_15932 [Caenorhabditis remanei]
MTDGKFKVLALLIGVAFVTITVGIFSPAWLCEQTYTIWENFDVCGGIVPYYSNEYAWAAVASWLMFISFAIFLLILFFLFKAHLKVRDKGYTIRNRKWFRFIAVASLIVAIFTATAVILFVVYAAKYKRFDNSYSLGYSAWLSVAAGVISLLICILSLFISVNEYR